MQDWVEIRTALASAARPWSPDVPPGAGFYAFFLARQGELPGIRVPSDGLLYIGMTKRDFSVRDHFYPPGGHSASCTLRRSLAALLKARLGLSAQPRALGPGWRNVYNYRFPQEQELALSRWMTSHLRVARIPFDGDLVSAEMRLILALEPPLNLTGWQNPQKSRIMTLRRACVREAEAERTRLQHDPIRLNRAARR